MTSIQQHHKVFIESRSREGGGGCLVQVAHRTTDCGVKPEIKKLRRQNSSRQLQVKQISGSGRTWWDREGRRPLSLSSSKMTQSPKPKPAHGRASPPNVHSSRS